MKKDSGFIQIIAFIIIFVVVVLYFGKNPMEIWGSIKPYFVLAVEIFIGIIEFLIRMITTVWQSN